MYVSDFRDDLGMTLRSDWSSRDIFGDSGRFDDVATLLAGWSCFDPNGTADGESIDDDESRALANHSQSAPQRGTHDPCPCEWQEIQEMLPWQGGVIKARGPRADHARRLGTRLASAALGLA